jgi:DNA-binding XRE family transcriptional regulator
MGKRGSTSEGNKQQRAKPDFGYFYVIQIMPDAAPEWFKLGYTNNISVRLKTFQTTCPTAQVIRTWTSKPEWERRAIADLTQQGCEQVGVEVFICKDLPGLLQRGESFFQEQGIVPTIPPPRRVLQAAAQKKEKPKARRELSYLPYLRAWRLQRGLTMNGLAAIAGVSKATIGTLENMRHQAKLDTVRKLARALKTSPALLASAGPQYLWYR